jgi:hypothetical protein
LRSLYASLILIVYISGVTTPAWAVESTPQIVEGPKTEAEAAAEPPPPPPEPTLKEILAKKETDANDEKIKAALATKLEVAKEEKQSTPARSVRFNLKPVDEAKFYEIMVIPEKNIWSVPFKTVVSKENLFVRFRLSPGKYNVRSRSLDQDQAPGQWGPYTPFDVDFRAITKMYPSEGLEIEPRGSKAESIIFEWPEEAKHPEYYFFRLKDSKNNIVRMAVTKQSWIKSDVNVNSTYRWMVTPLASKEQYQAVLKRDSLFKYIKFHVLVPDDSGRGTYIKITEHPKASKYQFEVVGVDNVDNTSGPSILDSDVPEKRFRLPPGEYEMRARTVFPGEEVSEWSAPSRFFIKRFVPEGIDPVKAEVVDPTDDEKAEVKLSWKADKKAGFYKVFIYNENNELIITDRTQEAFYVAKLPDNKKYKWAVRAYSSREIASESVNPERIETEVFSIDKYIPLELNSAEEPSQFYGWLKNISSIENYEGRNYDNNAIVDQKIMGTEIESAVGYWFRKRKFGLLAHGSMASLTYDGQQYFYANYGAHLGYRYLMEDGRRLRVWLGMTYRENPEVLTHPFTQVVLYDKIKSMGPQIQVAYFRPINDRWGMNYSGSFYLGMMPKGDPYDTPQKKSISYRASIQTSYTWTKQTTVMCGYTYNVEQGAYASGDTPGATNTSKIQGHYLGLTLEFALADKVK